MTAFQQDPEGLPARIVWLVGLGVIAISAILVVIAWQLVAPPPPPARPLTVRSTLEHGLFDRANGGLEVRAAGALRLQHYQWVDREARVVHIPIDRAIDAVVADPSLIGAPSQATAGGVGQ